MASIYKDVPLAAPASVVWDAVRDFGAVHTRLAPGFVTDTRLDGDARIVTFASGRTTMMKTPAIDRILRVEEEGRSIPAGAVQRAAHDRIAILKAGLIVP